MAQIDAAFPVNFVKYRISATHVSEHWTLWGSIQADMKTSEKEKHAESAQKICIHTFNLKRHLMPHVSTNRIHNQKSSFFRESRTDIRFYHFRNFSITNVNELISAPRTSTKKRRRRRKEDGKNAGDAVIRRKASYLANSLPNIFSTLSHIMLRTANIGTGRIKFLCLSRKSMCTRWLKSCKFLYAYHFPCHVQPNTPRQALVFNRWQRWQKTPSQIEA